jgi:type I restriction enzyme R subunit
MAESKSTFNIISEGEESTVLSEYIRKTPRANSYQSEAQLEESLICQLEKEGYDYLNIHSEEDLIVNLRLQLESLNHRPFTDAEWDKYYKEYLCNENEGIVEKTNKIQSDYIYPLKKDENDPGRNVILIDKENVHNNKLQVINQYEIGSGRHNNRYDVTILVNGLPLVHIELKKRGIAIKEAFNQIDRYQRDSFWASSGLYNYAQIFVVSNGTDTKYYSNTTRFNWVDSQAHSHSKKNKTSNSFEFTSFWADRKNKIIPDLEDFAATFLAPHTILNVLTKYCVFTSEKMLMVMRPYQIAATEAILSKIEISNNYHKVGTRDAGGYVWHTTGSGKTLTSFKTAQLATNLPYIDKVLFVVDRKDLDYQTMKEYDRFEKGAANGNTSTKILEKQLDPSSDARIVVTTIQKLDNFIKKNPGHPIYDKHVVIIFDECHRSQFGEMHKQITKHFKQYHLFGFTGTPIFAKNANLQNDPNFATTEQVFGDKLHVYTIVDAINDHNVLPFRAAYHRTMKPKPGVPDTEIEDIDDEKIMIDPRRISGNVTYILQHFNQATKRNGQAYEFRKTTNVVEMATTKDRLQVDEQKSKVYLNGFNAMLATASIPMAMAYYTEFKKQMEALPANERLRIATIYSFAPNEEEEVNDGLLDDENSDSADGLDETSREFLEKAIKDYNAMFGTSYDTSADKFGNYYKDVSLRMKNRDLDLLIVVNMFLTGFDVPTMNTLFVDKSLKYHGLIQAFSRTNRILNSVKSFGNIVCFRNLEKRTDEAIGMFGDKDAAGIVLLKSYKDYYEGYNDPDGKHHSGYVELISELQANYPIGEQIIGEENTRKFIALFGHILRRRNILSAFDEFAGNEILSERDYQDYQSMYIDLYEQLRGQKDGEKEVVNDDIVFEVELIKQVEINVDYILRLVEKLHDENVKGKAFMEGIEKAINSTLQLRSKKELIMAFILQVDGFDDLDGQWVKYIDKKKASDLQDIITSEHLDSVKTQKYMDDCFSNGYFKTIGTEIDNLLPPMSRFGGSQRDAKKTAVIKRLKKYYETYFDIGM